MVDSASKVQLKLDISLVCAASVYTHETNDGLGFNMMTVVGILNIGFDTVSITSQLASQDLD